MFHVTSYHLSWYYEDLDSENKKSRKLLKAPGFTTPTFGEWNSNTLLAGGIGGTGVTCIFDRASLDSAVLSAYENPMAVSHAMSTPGCIEFGVMGNVDTIPANYSITMILSVEKGVNQAVSRWGKELREAYGKHTLDISRAMDVTLQYLGFTTDNGAYYYYNTEPDTDYGQTLVSVKKYADRVGIPYSYVLLDSWWYYKGQNGGVRCRNLLFSYPYILLYTPYTPLYPPIHPYILLYTLIHPLYTPYKPFYTPIHPYTPIYTHINPYTPI